MVDIESNEDVEDGEWIVDHEFADYLWNTLINSDSIIPTRDPPFILDINMDFFDNPPSDSMNWWHMTRIPDRTYNTSESWENIPARWNVDEPKRYKIENVFEKEKHEETKIILQWYTYHGAMVTIELEDIGEGWVDIFIRIPCHTDISHAAKDLYADNRMLEHFESQVRTFNPDRFNELANEDSYFHAHYWETSKDPSIHSRDNLEYAIDKLIDIIEESTRMW